MIQFSLHSATLVFRDDLPLISAAAFYQCAATNSHIHNHREKKASNRTTEVTKICSTK
jgi:hypothetical protein